jgi:uncharacterized protein
MRPFTVVLTLGLLCAAPFVMWADDASRKAKCAELLRVTNSEQMMVQMLDSMQKMQTAEFAKMELPAEARASAAEIQRKADLLVRRMLNWETLKPRFIDLYAATYTEAELDGILAFYNSAAGRAMLEKMPQLMQGAVGISQEAMAALGPEMGKIVEEAKQKK